MSWRRDVAIPHDYANRRFVRDYRDVVTSRRGAGSTGSLSTACWALWDGIVAPTYGFGRCLRAAGAARAITYGRDFRNPTIAEPALFVRTYMDLTSVDDLRRERRVFRNGRFWRKAAVDV